MKPIDLTIGGGFRYVACYAPGIVYLPGWLLRFGVNHARPRYTPDGPAALYELSLDFGLRKDALREGDSPYLHSWRLSLDWPVRRIWRRNLNQSRRWTGRDRELVGVEWCVRFGRRRVHYFRRPHT